MKNIPLVRTLATMIIIILACFQLVACGSTGTPTSPDDFSNSTYHGLDPTDDSSPYSYTRLLEGIGGDCFDCHEPHW